MVLLRRSIRLCLTSAMTLFLVVAGTSTAFAATVPTGVSLAFQATYSAAGGVAAVGNPVNTIHIWPPETNPRVWAQDFDAAGWGGAGAIVFREGASRAYWVHGSIWGKYRDSGGARGFLGCPTGGEAWLTRLPNGTEPRYQKFDGGEVWHHHLGPRDGGTYLVYGAILQAWQGLGGTGSFLGMPASDEYASSGQRRSDFENGYILWNASSGCRVFTKDGTPVSDGFEYPLGKPAGQGYRVEPGADFCDPSYWNWRGVWHPAEDWNAIGREDLGDPVYACSNGRVVSSADFGSGWGNIIVVEHVLPDGSKFWSQYAHLSARLKTVGAVVLRGDQVGRVGTAPGSTGPHLHFEIRRYGTSTLAPNTWPAGQSKAWVESRYVDPTDCAADSYAGAGFIESHRSLLKVIRPQTGGGPLDLVIAVDVTGSMWDDLDQVKNHANAIVDKVAATNADYRIAIIAYRDWGDGSDRIKFYDFSSDPNVVKGNIDALQASGGGDWMEGVYSSLMEGMLRPWWRTTPNKSIILIGDAPPHSPDNGYTELDVVTLAERVDPVRIFSIVVGGDPTTKEAFASLSDRTGGLSFDAASAVDVPGAIIDAVGAIGSTTWPVEMDFDPSTLKLSSQGNLVTVRAQPNEGWDPREVDTSTLLLNWTYQPVRVSFVPALEPTTTPALELKFDRASVSGLLTPGLRSLSLSGSGESGAFVGVDTIRVIGN